LKMRDLTRYRIYMEIIILCGVIFLAVKLAYEWPQKFDHFGAFIKEGALEKYEPYLGNKHLLEEGLPPRKEITGHLHNKEALKNPSVKEYEIALDPVYADPTNRKMDRPHFWPMPATDKIATIEKSDVKYATMFLPQHSSYCSSDFPITGLPRAHVLGEVRVHG